MHRLPQIVALIAFVALSSALVGIGLLSWSTRQETLPVPDFVGVQLADARREAEASGLLLRVESEVYSDDAPAATILRQEPIPGRMVKVGRHVNLTVSLGKRQLLVPRLRGSSREDAAFILADDGLRVGEVLRVSHAQLPSEQVIATAPAQGTAVREGDTVDLLVSSGPEARFAVPDLLGMPLDEAFISLNRRGLQLEELEVEERPALPHNTVIGQEPVPGGAAEPGAPLVLKVSRSYDTSPDERAGRYQVVDYTVPVDLVEVPIAFVRRRGELEETILEGTYEGGDLIKIPVLVQPRDEILVRLRGTTVWSERY